MALIICPECEKKISDKANSCPNCGYPIRELSESSGSFETEQYNKVSTLRREMDTPGKDKGIFLSNQETTPIRNNKSYTGTNQIFDRRKSYEDVNSNNVRQSASSDKFLKICVFIAIVFVIVVIVIICNNGPAKGTYIFDSFKFNEEEVISDSWRELMDDAGVNVGALVIKGGGKASLNIYGQKSSELTYDKEYFYAENGNATAYKMSGNTITLTVTLYGITVDMSFTKED
ncbi:MAG: zinc ribbon domain-containing protein [Eubacterium sp.]|nr:zinc ribbon domain-containing protein [Eubacterium sp.]